MELTRKQMLKLVAGAGAGAAVPLRSPFAAADADDADDGVIERDVLVVGGGSSGTYTAVRLRDLGRSVVVVESQNRLGGHCETYVDPATGATVDIGVIVFHDLPVVRDYFARFGVPLTAAAQVAGPAAYVDMRTGLPVAGYAPPAPTALGAYYEILQRYPYLTTGYDLPDPVPAELLQPFGQLVASAGLASIVPIAFAYGQGLGDLLRLPALYVLKLVGLNVVGSILNDSYLTTAGHDNSVLYEKVTAFLGQDVLLSTNVTGMRRGANGVVATVRTPRGRRIIHARTLVIAVPPLLGNLAVFDLDDTEASLFGRFEARGYYTGIVRLSGVPDDLTVQNTGDGTAYNLPALPGMYALYPSGIPGLHNVKYGSPFPLTDERVQADIVAEIARLGAAGTFPVGEPEFAIFKGHVPFELTVPAADIAAGFYRRLNALQGRRGTFYNGAAFQVHNSSMIWQFTETLLPRIAAAAARGV